MRNFSTNIGLTVVFVVFITGIVFVSIIRNEQVESDLSTPIMLTPSSSASSIEFKIEPTLTSTPAVGIKDRTSEGQLIRDTNNFDEQPQILSPISNTIDLAPHLGEESRVAVRIQKANGEVIRYLLDQGGTVDSLLEPGDKVLSIVHPHGVPPTPSSTIQPETSTSK